MATPQNNRGSESGFRNKGSQDIEGLLWLKNISRVLHFGRRRNIVNVIAPSVTTIYIASRLPLLVSTTA